MQDKRKLRNAVRYAYDIQNLRIGGVNRSAMKGGDAPPVELDERDKRFLADQAKALKKLEKDAMKEIARHVKPYKVAKWLKKQKGCGDGVIAGVLVSEFDINRTHNPSQFVAFAGLDVGEDNHAPHPEKGQRNGYNSWLRSKCLEVLGGGLLKAKNEHSGTLYREKKHERETRLGPCMLCVGTGKAKKPKVDEDGRVSEDAGKGVKCWNCVGDTEAPGAPFTPDRAPWGKGAAHRHRHALRVMVRQFIIDFWLAWREADGLPTTLPYNEARRGRIHHGQVAV
jgi:hypothetical protein